MLGMPKVVGLRVWGMAGAFGGRGDTGWALMGKECVCGREQDSGKGLEEGGKGGQGWRAVGEA